MSGSTRADLCNCPNTATAHRPGCPVVPMVEPEYGAAVIPGANLLASPERVDGGLLRALDRLNVHAAALHYDFDHRYTECPSCGEARNILAAHPATGEVVGANSDNEPPPLDVERLARALEFTEQGLIETLPGVRRSLHRWAQRAAAEYVALSPSTPTAGADDPLVRQWRDRQLADHAVRRASKP